MKGSIGQIGGLTTTKVDQVQLRAPAKPGHMDLWQRQRRKQGHSSHTLLLGPPGAEQVPQHPLVETAGLGWAGTPVP